MPRTRLHPRAGSSSDPRRRVRNQPRGPNRFGQCLRNAVEFDFARSQHNLDPLQWPATSRWRAATDSPKHWRLARRSLPRGTFIGKPRQALGEGFTCLTLEGQTPRNDLCNGPPKDDLSLVSHLELRICGQTSESRRMGWSSGGRQEAGAEMQTSHFGATLDHPVALFNPAAMSDPQTSPGAGRQDRIRRAALRN